MIADAYIDDVRIHNVAGNIALSQFEGLGTPPPRENRPPRARRHGAIELTTYYGPRVFTLAGYVKEATTLAMWETFDDLKESMALNGIDHTLKFKREGFSTYEICNVTVGGECEPSLRVVGGVLPWSVILVASDPRLYSETLHTQSFSSTANITNAGNFSSPPKITFTGGGANPGLRNDALSSENELRIAYTMIGGDSVVVDVRSREVLLNGDSRPDILNVADSDFWSLTRGINHVTKLGGAASVAVEWRDARV